MWSYNYTQQNDELYHHGVLGMKWGVRRYQNKDGSLTDAGKRKYGTSDKKITDREYKKEKKVLRDKYASKDPRTIKAKNLEKEALKLHSKYDFDGDDGGGGSTEASRKAGEKYMQLWSDADYLYNAARLDANKKATTDMLNKYGTKKYNAVNRHDKIKAVAALATIAAIPISLIYTDLK